MALWGEFCWTGPISKSLIQFSVDGRGCVLSLLFGLSPNYGRSNDSSGILLQKDLLCSVPQPCSRPLSTIPPPETPDTNRQVWFSLLWGHLSFLGPGVHKVLFAPCKSLFPQSCGSSVIKSPWTSKSNSLGSLSLFSHGKYQKFKVINYHYFKVKLNSILY